jgi:hypothetical protein
MGIKDIFFIIMIAIVVWILYKITRIKLDTYLNPDSVLEELLDQKAKDEQLSLQIEALQFVVGHEDELREERALGFKTSKQIKPQLCKGNLVRQQKTYNL